MANNSNFFIFSLIIAVATLTVFEVDPTSTPHPTCPTGPNLHIFRRYCYYYIYTNKLSFKEAQESCVRSFGPNAGLVSISDYEVNIFLLDITSRDRENRGSIWIGLWRPKKDAAFRWIDNSPLTYTFWEAKKPSSMTEKHCVEFDEHMGRWNNIECEGRHNFICQVKQVDPNFPPPPQCPTGTNWTIFREYCYYFERTQKLSFREAQLICDCKFGKYANLATIPDADVNGFIMGLTVNDSVHTGNIWIGLWTPKYDAEFRWIDNSTMKYTNWAGGEPNYLLDEHCVEFYDNRHKPNKADIGQWNNINCEESRRNFICQIRPNCPPGFYHMKDTRNCYQLIMNDVKWSEAHALCSKNQSDAKLARIMNIEERDFVNKLLTFMLPTPVNEFIRHIWIAGQRQESGNCNSSFVWKPEPGTELAMNYTNWASKQPDCYLNDEDCVQIRKYEPFQWSDFNCSEKAYALCQVFGKVPN